MQRLMLAVAVACLIPEQPSFAKDKVKSKQKSFEAIETSDFETLLGHYLGVENRYWLDVSFSESGKLEVALYEEGERVRLEDLTLAGARLQATKVDPNGIERSFDATFGNRILNGDRRFGLLVEGMFPINDEVVANGLFFRRVSAPR